MQQQEPLSLLWCQWGLNCKNQAGLLLPKVNNTQNQAYLQQANLDTSQKSSQPAAGQYSKFEPACGGPQSLNTSQKSSLPAAGQYSEFEPACGGLPSLDTSQKSSLPAMGKYSEFEPACGGPLWLDTSHKSSPPAAGYHFLTHLRNQARLRRANTLNLSPQNTFFPENSNFQDVSLNISQTRTS